MEMIQVACAVILNNRKLLAVQRSETMNFPFKWEFPGGKIDLGETAEDCLHRELKEELNISVRIESRLSATVYIDANINIKLIPFVVTYKEGKIVLAEHCDAKWITKKEMNRLDWAPADVPIVNTIVKSDYIN